MNEIEFIEEMLAETAPLVRDHYTGRAGLRASAKTSLNDLVTEADLTVQRHIVAQIKGRFAGDVAVAEEEGLNRYPGPNDGRAWVIDPIDGTMNFVRGQFPVFGVSIAFVRNGVPDAAGVVFPMTEELFLAERGAGAVCNNRRLAVSEVDTVHAARGDVDFSSPEHRRETVHKFEPVIYGMGQLRCHGAAVAGLCAIAAGEADIYLHVQLSPWDYAGGLLLVEEAGGRVTRLDGAPVHLFDGGRGIAASNGWIHDELLGMLRAVENPT